MLAAFQIQTSLSQWYERARRDLPWRATRDPYRIWISEIMLQQTRVVAVLRTYMRFLEQFADIRKLAAASDDELLLAWKGLGYYSRVRNARLAARKIVEAGGEFPRDYDSIRALPGVGDYTAAAVASISFGQPYPVLDGNVLRVLSRLTAEGGDIGSTVTRRRLRSVAGELLDRRNPGQFNQAMMELGATVCLPRNPQCLVCPLEPLCEARRRGLQTELPVKARAVEWRDLTLEMAVVRNDGHVLIRERPPDEPRMRGFWELPDAAALPGFTAHEVLGKFRHTITCHRYRVQVVEGSLQQVPPGLEWLPLSRLDERPLTTMTSKALRFLE